MLRSAVHPATHLLFWLLLLLAIQLLNGVGLAFSLVFLPLSGRSVFQRGGRLVWRARWLFFSLFVILSWGTAGEPLWAGVAAPTHDGLREALAQTGRLLLTLMSVAALLEAMPLPELLTAVHPMLHPLRYLGVDPDRGVIRLMLVLRYAETLPRSRDWRTLLDVPASSESETLQLDVPPLRRTDYLVLLMLGVSLIVVALR
jgi:energy-coupling factor transporter transmembrane protein EcfT